jgi:hypothetical protein
MQIVINVIRRVNDRFTEGGTLPTSMAGASERTTFSGLERSASQVGTAERAVLAEQIMSSKGGKKLRLQLV